MHGNALAPHHGERCDLRESEPHAGRQHHVAAMCFDTARTEIITRLERSIDRDEIVRRGGCAQS